MLLQLLLPAAATAAYHYDYSITSVLHVSRGVASGANVRHRLHPPVISNTNDHAPKPLFPTPLLCMAKIHALRPPPVHEHWALIPPPDVRVYGLTEYGHALYGYIHQPHLPPPKTMYHQVDQGRENEVTRLGIRQETLFEVSHAPPRLAQQVTAAVESAIRTARVEGGSEEDPANTEAKANHESTTKAAATVGVPRAAVDNAIRSHHVKEGVSYSLYLLHPNAEGHYHYTHETSGGDADAEGGAEGDMPGGVRDGSRSGSRDGSRSESRDTFPGGCGYVGWVGQHERYAWLDLGAYVSFGWGPRKRAFGAVSPSTLPSLSAAGRGRGSAWLSSELAALAYRTASQLIVPPFIFTPAGLSGEDFRPMSSAPLAARWSDYKADPIKPDVRPRDDVVVRLFLVCEEEPCPASRVGAWAGLDTLLREPESRGEQWGGSRLMPRVTVELEEVVLWKNPHLAAGIQQAVQSTKGGSSSAAPNGMSLEAAELRYWLRLFFAGRARRRHSGSGGSQRGGENNNGVGVSNGDSIATRVVPLFVINLDAEVTVLLDHSVRSTVFPDMVVSVTGRDGTAASSTFGCGGKRVMIGDGAASSVADGRQDGDGVSPREYDGGSGGGKFDDGLLRDTVASLAQMIWGAPPRSLSWDPVRERLGTDFLWATGASLHTPLSSHSSLTFTERDAYPRAHILRKMDAAVGAARDVLEQAAAAEPRLSLALCGGDYTLVVESWRGVQVSLVKCLDELAVHHHESAERFADVLEGHVARLGAALSRGFLDGMYRAACDCRAAANGPKGFPAGGRGVGGGGGGGGVGGGGGSGRFSLFMFEGVCYILAVLCVSLAACRRFCVRAGGDRRRFGGRRKHKFS